MYNTRPTIYTWRSIALCSFLAFLSLISLFIARHANYIRLLTYVVTSVIDLFFSDNQFLTELKFYRNSPKFDASLFLLPLFFDLLHSCLAILQLVVRSRFSHPLFLLPRFVLLSQRPPASARSLYTRVHTADVASWTPVAWASRCASRDPTRVHQRGWCVSACTRVDISHAVDLRTLGWLLPSFFSLLPFLPVFSPLPPRLSPSPPLSCSRAFLFFPSCFSLPRPLFHRFLLFLCSPLLFCALKCSPSTFFRRHRATSLSANSPEVRTWEFCLSRISELLFHHPLFLRVPLPLKPRDVSSGGGLRL